MGVLEGGPHTIFVGVEGDSDAALEEAAAAVGAGLADHVMFRPNPDASSALPGIIHMPAKLPPWLRIVLVWLEGDGVEAAILVAHEALGPDGIAAATDGAGRYLIELGGDDIAAVDAAASAFAGLDSDAVVAQVGGGGLAYA
jgi:FAD/FMN-containing dehydrogenase